MFHLQNPQNKKIFLHLPQVDSTAPKNHHIHFGVTCDNCENGPIIGFRYKCMECEDFDLCGTCEGKMAHNEHVMLRLPGDIKSLGGGKPHHSKRRHGHHGKKHSRCPIGFDILSTIEDLNLKTAMKNSEQQTSSSSEEASPKKPDHNAKKYEEHMKTSMDMLSNFHKMFSKILDPLGSEIVLEVHRDTKDSESVEKELPTEKENVSEKDFSIEKGNASEKDNVSMEKPVEIQHEDDKMDEAAGSSTSFQEESNWEMIHKEKSSSPEVVGNVYPEMRAVLVPEKVVQPEMGAEVQLTSVSYPEMRAVLVSDCGSKMDVDDKAEDYKAMNQEPKKVTEQPTPIYHKSKFFRKQT